MAKIIHTSQAWYSIAKSLNSRRLAVEHPDDISKELISKKGEYEAAKIQAAIKIDAFIKNLAEEIEDDRKSLKEKLHTLNEVTKLKVEQTQIDAHLLEDEKGLFRKLLNIAKIRKLKLRIRTLIINRDKFAKSAQEKISKKEEDFKICQAQREQLIEGQCQTIKDNIAVLEQVLKSPELVGAIAELDLIKSLAKLPYNFVVINDAKLVSKKSIHFDGEWLKSAQIDHVVVSPAGVFVIETKNWSRKSADSGGFFDPYQQVKRARYLVDKYLGPKLRGAKVRTIIAHNGNIPEKPNDSYAKTLLFHEVPGYINWFKEKILTDEEILDIANSLS